VAVGRLRPPFVDDVAHYAKLLSGHARLELVEVREDAWHRGPKARGAAPRRVPADAYVSLLAADGQQLDSIRFARFVEERRMSRRDLCFVIGGAFGLELEHADHRLSLGPMTLPHQLARVVLLEQLYRAHKIIAGEPYHH
jgi:23S rRNA (pseudouridine1915-N3)-methyltransferase